ncbi:MAG TPA: hypothetical protein ENK80_04230 [Rhodobacterales bacterium]|nr:hypothetical protein [Rhodobacterales bacterium]
MIEALTSLAPLPAAALGAGIGLVLGLVHFASLARVTALYLAGTRPAAAVGLQLGRLALLGGVLTALAFIGAPALLGGALGVLAGRAIILARARRRG